MLGCIGSGIIEPMARSYLFVSSSGSEAARRAVLASPVDIDLAVISPQFETMSLLERYEQIGLANRDLQAPVQVIGFAPSQVATCEPESFLADILSTGIEVPVHPHEATLHECAKRSQTS